MKNMETRDPLLLLENIFQWSGMVTTIPKVKPKYYPFMAFWAHFTYLNCYLATIFFLLDDYPFFDKMESLQCFVSLFHMFGKFLNFHYNTGPYRKLLVKARKMWEDAKARPENKELIAEIGHETEISIKIIILMFAGAVPAAILMTIAYNLRVGFEKRQTLYMVWAPVPKSWYYTTCIFQGVFMASSLHYLAITLAGIYAHCVLAAGHMKILSHMLQSNPVDMKASVKLHQNVLEYIKQIQDYFAGQLFMELFLSSLQNACRAYMCMKMISESDPKAVGAVSILILCLSGPFIDCLCGHVITKGSESVFTSAYQSAWYNASKRDKRSLTIIMTMSTRIIRLHYRGLIDFSMERYSMVTQATYSYITLLKGADIA